MPHLLHGLLERGLFPPTQFLFQPSKPALPLKINGSVLIALQLLLRLRARFPGGAEEEAMAGLESLLGALDILERDYFTQLGSNPMHFVELLEAATAFYRAVGLPAARLVALRAASTALKYLTGQDKKATATFFTRVLPLLEDVLGAGDETDLAAGDGSLSGFQAALSAFFRSRGGLAELERELTALFATGNCESLPAVRAHLEGWKPETGSWQGQLLAWLMAPRPTVGLKAMVFRLAEEEPIQDRRSFFFRLFMASVACETSSSSSGPAVALLLLQLEHSAAYEHRNDALHHQQTAFLRSLLAGMRGHPAFPRLLAIMVRLNFYLVREEELEHVGLEDGPFLCGLLEAALVARQLPEVLQVLIERGAALPADCVGTLKRVARPVLQELLQVILTGLQSSSSPRSVSVALGAASLLAAHGPGTEDLARLLPHCLGHLPSLGPAACEPFCLAMFSRSAALRRQYAAHTTGLELVDGLLRPAGTALSPLSAVRLLPMLATGSAEAMALILHEAVVRGCPEYGRIFALARFYECPAARTGLLSALLAGWDAFVAAPTRLTAILCQLPRELCAECPEAAAELCARLTALALPAVLPAVAHLLASPAVPVSLPSFLASARIAGPTASAPMEAILNAALRQHSIPAILGCLAGMEACPWLRPLYAPSLIEAAEGEGRVALDAFAMHMASGLLARALAGEEAAGESLEALSTSAEEGSQLAIHLRALLDEGATMAFRLPRLLRARIRLSEEPQDLLPLLAHALALPEEEAGRSAHLVLERMALQAYPQALLQLLRLRDPALLPAVHDCLQRGLASTDKAKARLAFEAASHVVRSPAPASSTALRLAQRLVLAKGVRALSNEEAAACLQAASAAMAMEGCAETAVRLLAGLQAAYWHLLRSMLPAYVGVLMRCHEHLLLQHLDDQQLALGLYTRLLGDLAGISGPGSSVLAFALPPLLLQHVRLAVAHPHRATCLQAPLLGLLRHLERPTDRRQHQAPSVEHMERLQRLCHHRPDERSLIARLLQEYREHIKYTGKA